MPTRFLHRLTRAITAAVWIAAGSAAAADTPMPEAAVARIATAFERGVDKRLVVPPDEQLAYAARLQSAFAEAGLADLEPQYALVVDRGPLIQAAHLYWKSVDGWHWIGASTVSTGLPGAYEHFATPLGIFEHSLANLDFRAEGTFNDLGIRGYGLKGMRVFDFGWVLGERGWGAGGMSPMRLQMHATDPVLESLLGQRHSKGCIRIPATLDRFLDHYGILDANYERAASLGVRLNVLLPDREPTPGAGRYLVVIESERAVRPEWALFPAPAVPAAVGLAGRAARDCPARGRETG